VSAVKEMGTPVVVLSAVLAKSSVELASNILMPVPVKRVLAAIQDPPKSGHSKTFVVALKGPNPVGSKVSATLQVLSATQPLKENPNGEFNPEPDASSSEYPASGETVKFSVSSLLRGTGPKSKGELIEVVGNAAAGNVASDEATKRTTKLNGFLRRSKWCGVLRWITRKN
jgi:hypothetical protein